MKEFLGFLLIVICLVTFTASSQSKKAKWFSRASSGKSLFCSDDTDCNLYETCQRMFPDCKVPKKCSPTNNMGSTCTNNSDCWDPVSPPCDGTRCGCLNGTCACAECYTEVGQSCEPILSRASRTGTSFHTGFLYSLSFTSGLQYLFIQSPCAMVNITVPFLSIFDEPYEIRNSTVISLSPIIQVKNHGVVTNKAVYIKSDNPVTVYWLNYKSFTNDGGRVLSDEDLGQEYILPGGRTGGKPERYEHFLLVSLKDGTIVNIEYPDNTPQETISLNRMETFRKRRHGISGTIVTSNEPIAVKSGHECFTASNNVCDLMSEQIPGNCSWKYSHSWIHEAIPTLLPENSYTFRPN